MTLKLHESTTADVLRALWRCGGAGARTNRFTPVLRDIVEDGYAEFLPLGRVRLSELGHLVAGTLLINPKENTVSETATSVVYAIEQDGARTPVTSFEEGRREAFRRTIALAQSALDAMDLVSCQQWLRQTRDVVNWGGTEDVRVLRWQVRDRKGHPVILLTRDFAGGAR